MRARLAALIAVCAPLPLHAQAAAPAPSASPATAPASAPFVKAEGDAAVRDLATELEDNYVQPETGKRYAQALRAKLASGAYASFHDAKSFAQAVTADLQAIAPDAHLRLFSPAMAAKLTAGPKDEGGPQSDTFIEKSGWLAPGVAYISFLAMMGDEPTLKAEREFLASHANAKVLIIDARHHHGGGLDEIDLIFSQIFDKPTDLLTMDTRAAVAARYPLDFADGPTVRQVAAPDGIVRQIHGAVPAKSQSALAKAKVFVLTSSKTASAGEHLALALKKTARGTLVGETTRGAGNYGRPFTLPGGYAAFVPVGRTYDPATGDGWEGVGVKPDVAVPADKALDEALKLAGVNATAEAALASLH